MKKYVIKGISHELRWKMIFIQSQINHGVSYECKKYLPWFLGGYDINKATNRPWEYMYS